MKRGVNGENLKKILDFVNEQMIIDENLSASQACKQYIEKFEEETGEKLGFSTAQKWYAKARLAYPDEVIEPNPRKGQGAKPLQFVPKYQINREEFVPFVQSQIEAGSSIAEACRLYSKKTGIPDLTLYGWYNNHIVVKGKKQNKKIILQQQIKKKTEQIPQAEEEVLEDVQELQAETTSRFHHTPTTYTRRRDEKAAVQEQEEDFLVTITKIMSAGDSAGLDIQKIFGALKPLFELAAEAAQCKQASEENKVLSAKVADLEYKVKTLASSNEAKEKCNAEMQRRVNELDGIVSNFLQMPSPQKLLHLGDFTEQLKYSVDQSTGLVSRAN